MDCLAVCSPFLVSTATFNALVTPSLITSSTNGYDGSMMNGLQSLDQWEDYFHRPTGGRLGLLNAIQVRVRFSPNAFNF